MKLSTKTRNPPPASKPSATAKNAGKAVKKPQGKVPQRDGLAKYAKSLKFM